MVLLVAGLLLVGAAIVAHYLRQKPLEYTGSRMQGWCCVDAGSACLPQYAFLDCYNAGGIIFDADGDRCSRACTAQ